MTISSESEARQHVLSILPERDVRQKCLEVFAEAVTEADACGRDRWAVTYRTGRDMKVRLIAGHIIVCTLGNGRIWMALDREILATSNARSLLEASGDWEWGTGRFAEYRQIPSKNGYYLPSEKHLEIWPVIRQLHFESIRRAADQTTMDPRTPGRHSPEILQYLRDETGRDLPDPLY
jgi:putative restriction endonuclease